MIKKMHAETLSRPERFLTKLTGVGQTINMSLCMFFDVGTSGGAVVTSLAVMSPVSLLHQLLYLLIDLGHVSEGNNLLTSSSVVCLGNFSIRKIWSKWKPF